MWGDCKARGYPRSHTVLQEHTHPQYAMPNPIPHPTIPPPPPRPPHTLQIHAWGLLPCKTPRLSLRCPLAPSQPSPPTCDEWWVTFVTHTPHTHTHTHTHAHTHRLTHAHTHAHARTRTHTRTPPPPPTVSKCIASSFFNSSTGRPSWPAISAATTGSRATASAPPSSSILSMMASLLRRTWTMGGGRGRVVTCVMWGRGRRVGGGGEGRMSCKGCEGLRGRVNGKQRGGGGGKRREGAGDTRNGVWRRQGVGTWDIRGHAWWGQGGGGRREGKRGGGERDVDR